MPESQGTSVEARSCGETGEELFRKEFFPLGKQMEQLTRLAQEPPTLRAAELVRCYGPQETMAGGTRGVLLDQLAAPGQRCQLAAQPTQHLPDRTVIQPALVDDSDSRRRLVASRPAAGSGRFTVGMPVVFQIAGSQEEQGWTGVAFIGEYESRDNR